MYIHLYKITKKLTYIYLLTVEGQEMSRVQTRESLNNKVNSTKISNVTHEVKDWWHEQLCVYSDSSDEDCL